MLSTSARIYCSKNSSIMAISIRPCCGKRSWLCDQMLLSITEPFGAGWDMCETSALSLVPMSDLKRSLNAVYLVLWTQLKTLHKQAALTMLIAGCSAAVTTASSHSPCSLCPKATLSFSCSACISSTVTFTAFFCFLSLLRNTPGVQCVGCSRLRWQWFVPV